MQTRHGSIALPEHAIHVNNQPFEFAEFCQIVGSGGLHIGLAFFTGMGVHHFGLLVEDMSDALSQTQSAGLNMIQDGSGFGLDGDGHYAYIETKEHLGVTLELIQRPKARVEPERIYPLNSVSV